MISFLEPVEERREEEGCLDSQFWHACAGSIVQMPQLNSKVCYFPQGHAEHACEKVEFKNVRQIPSYFPCKVTWIKYMADRETDEVYAKIGLSAVEDDGNGSVSGYGSEPKLNSFAKTLTQSDANNGGGFSVPRYCAETIFPKLDYRADPPVQILMVKDVHGRAWRFRHIYRGTPRRHLLTTGWSSFVNNKKLVAGDSIVFLRGCNGELCVGIRRARGGRGYRNGRNSKFGGFSGVLSEDVNKLMGTCYGGNAKVTAACVLDATCRAATGQRFEVVYYPRVNSPAFCVPAGVVRAGTNAGFARGLRFKMAVEAEDCSRISWFVGSVISVGNADPRWPGSPWKFVEASWDEPDLLRNVKRVNPWSVELVTNLPRIHLPVFSQKKKTRFMEDPGYGNPSSSNSFGCLLLPTNPTPAGMQGARQAEFTVPPLFLFPTNESLSLNSSDKKDDNDNARPTEFKLFGQIILTEPQREKTSDVSDETESLESGDAAPSIDLAVLGVGSYEGLDESLRDMFG